MPIRLLRLTIISACVLALAACGSDHTIPASAAKTLVLTEHDLPGAFGVFAEGPTATLDTQGTPRANLQRFGRTSGWVVRFNRPGSTKTNGPLVVVSTVDVFGGQDGAKADLAAFRNQFRRDAARASGGQLRAVSGLGDETVAIASLESGPPAVRYFTIAWRERNTSASVTASGFTGRITLPDVVRLARRQQQKLDGAAG